ncbi:MAG: cadherin-like domain-containing protein, partial [Marivivens sp.]|nr:cadherin-like domain-containing protein [Marivivens sp.]
SDDTGTAVLGGDWDLEVQTGDVDTHSLDLADYDGVLAGLEYADLSTWSASGDSNADWVLLSGNRTVFQTYNGGSMYYVSADSDIINQAVQLTLRQTDNVVSIDGIDYQTGSPNDDDQFGFVLGFQDASNHILLEWGGNDRGTGAGLTLYRVVSGSRSVITSLTGAGEEWVGDVLYDFKVLYMSNQIKIMIDGVEVLNTGDLGANAFQAGGIGFYNQSQGGVEYGNVRYAPGSLTEVVPTPSNDTYAVTKNTTLTVDRFSGVLSNDYDGNLDAFNIVFDGQELTSGTSHSKTGSFGLFTLNSDGSFSYVPTTNAIGTDSFTYTLTDNDGTSSSATVTFYVREPNQAPTDIAITNNAVLSGAANDTSIGTLSTTDPDAFDAFDYAITSQSTTGLFKIVDGVLKVADGTLLTAGTHTVTVRTTDLGGATYSKVFVITAEQQDPFIALPSGEYTTATVNASNVTAPNTGFTVTARNIVGGVLSEASAANVSSNGTPSGFGVLGEASGDTKELGYNEAASLSEELIVKFDEIVPTASVKFAWGSDADATYTLYRQGVMVGSNTITISSLGSGDITAALAVTAPDGNGFDEIRFTAPGVEDDYLINEISYDRLNDVNSAAPAAVDEAADASSQDIAAITGGFTVLDGNFNDTLTLTLVGSPTVTLNGASHTLPATANALIANGVLTFATDGARTATGQAYTWTYNPGAADLDYLAAGDVVEITFTVKANDGNADSNLRTIKITIDGTNDAPVFGAVTGLTSTGGTSSSSSADLVSVFEVTEGPSSTPLALEAGQTVDIGLYTANAKGTAQLSFLSTFYNNETGMTASNISTRFDGSVPNYDLIFVFQPTSTMTDNEIASLTSFVNNGGRIFFIGENNAHFAAENANISDAITRLGGAITVLGGAYNDNNFDDGTVGLRNINNSPLMAGVTSFQTAYWAQLQIDANISQAVLVSDTSAGVDNRIAIADQAVGKGRVTLIADQNWLDNSYRIAGNETFLRNLAINSVQNVAVVSGGGNPNDGFGAAAGFDETNAPLVEGGTIAVSDVDLTDQVTSAVTNVSAVFDDGTVVDLATAMPSVFTAGQGMFTVSPADPAVLIDNTETTDDLTWTFDSGTETFDFLAQGEKITFTYTITVTDSQGVTATKDVDITINGTDDAPALSASATGTEMLTGTARAIAPGLTITDADSTTLSGAKVSVSNLKSGDVLAVSGTLPTGITASYSASTGVLTLSGSASLADYQAVLRAVTFDTTSTDTTDRTFDFSLGEALAFSGNGHYYEFV